MAYVSKINGYDIKDTTARDSINEINSRNYITETELNNKGYLTSVPSEYITESELNTVLGNLKFITITQTAYDRLSTKDPNTIYIISE